MLKQHEINPRRSDNICGENDQLVVHLNLAKMAEWSEAKNAKRRFVSNFHFLLETSIRSFRFASLNQFFGDKIGQLAGHFSHKGYFK